MKTNKKFFTALLSMLLALCMIFSMLPISALADEPIDQPEPTTKSNTIHINVWNWTSFWLYRNVALDVVEVDEDASSFEYTVRPLSDFTDYQYSSVWGLNGSFFGSVYGVLGIPNPIGAELTFFTSNEDNSLTYRVPNFRPYGGEEEEDEGEIIEINEGTAYSWKQQVVYFGNNGIEDEPYKLVTYVVNSDEETVEVNLKQFEDCGFTIPEGMILADPVWNVYEDGSGTGYAGGASFTLSYADDKTITSLYAQYREPTNDVIYMDGDQLLYTDPVPVGENTEARSLDNTDTDNFIGWATEIDGDVVYEAGAVITPEDDMTLYAVWQCNGNHIDEDGDGECDSENCDKVKYAVEYYFMDDNGEYQLDADKSQIVFDEAGTEVSVEAEEVEGYVFNTEKSVFSGTVDAEEILTLKLYYDVIYNVTFINGEETVDTISVTCGEATEAISLDNTDTDNFIGWATEIDGDVVYEAGAVITPEDDMTLYAVWQCNGNHVDEDGDGECDSENCDKVKYAVEYYFMDDNGEYQLDADKSQIVFDEAGTEVSVEAEEVEGYVFNTEKSVPSGTVDAEEALTLKLYYDIDRTPIVFSASLDKEDYVVGSNMTFTINTNKYVEVIAIVNEYGKFITKLDTSYVTNEDGTLTWTIVTRVKTKGVRTLEIWGADADRNFRDNDVAVYFSAQAAVEEGDHDPEIYTVEAPEEAKAKTPFTITVTTSTVCTKIGIFNSNGAALGKSNQTYNDKNGVRTWTMDISIGSKGQRAFEVKASDDDGNWSEAISFDIAVK